MFFYGHFDSTYILVLIGMVLSGIASGYMNHTFRKYNEVQSRKGYTATEAAQYILDKTKVSNVAVQTISGDLTDNYDARNKVLSLSSSVANSTSVAAIGVAAHECGHAVQDRTNYLPLRIRHSLVPVANFGSTISFPLILLGVFLSWNQTLISLGIFCFSLAFLFQLITLPVEINASRRALAVLSSSDMLRKKELPMVKKVLTAAALTYVAGTLLSFLQLVRLLLLFGGNRRR